jgi:sporulation integral membrane protein YtvI
MIEKTDYKPLLYLGLAIIIVTMLISVTIEYLFPFVAGILIAVMIEPVVDAMEKKVKLDRGVAVTTILIAIFCLLVYFSTVIATRLTFELGKLIKTLPHYNNYYNMAFDKISSYFFYFSSKIPEEVLNYFKTNLDQVFSTMSGFLSTFYSSLMNKVSMVPNMFLDLFIFLIFTFLFSYFLSKDKEKIIKFLGCVMPLSLQEKVKKVQLELFISFLRLVKAQIILVIITTAITILGFYALKVDYAMTLGLLCGLLDILPLFGPSLIFIPWIIFSAIVGNISFAVGLLVLYVITIGSRQILQAKVIGYNLGIDPLLTLFSIYLGIKVFGFTGLFIGPLTVVIVRALIHSGIIPPLVKGRA